MALFGRAMMGRVASSAPGHAGVAAWVAAHSSDVVRYYPMSSVSGGGSCDDQSPYNADATYAASASAGTFDNGEVCANFSAGAALAGDAAELDNIVAGFVIADPLSYISNSDSAWVLVCRDQDTGKRLFQFRIIRATEKLSFVYINGAGNPTATSTGTISSSSGAYALGWWWDNTTIRLYIGGSADGTVNAGATPPASTSNMALGYHNYAVSTDGGNFVGDMGSVVLLSAADANTNQDILDAWTNGYP